jgi:phenylacetate-coenzyme A ligase PaaK-like adenylate-forming protein
MLRHAAQSVPAYRELYRGIDLDACRIEELPSVTKAEVMDRFDEFVSDSRIKIRELEPWMQDRANLGKRYLGEFIPMFTSGSTGPRGIFVYTPAALELALAAPIARGIRFGAGTRRFPLQKLVRLLAGGKHRIARVSFGEGPNPTTVGTLHFPVAPGRLTERRTISLRRPMDEVVAELNAFQPDHLTSYPSVLAVLAREQLQGRLQLRFDSPTAAILSVSEPLPQETRGLARRAWGLEIREIYGAAECLTMALSCSLFDRMHLMSDLCILEVVDRDNRPVPLGSTGEKVLVTNLFNRLQPILRYEIDDVTGYSTEPCPCGLPFPRLLPVTGRTVDVVYVDRPGGGYEPVHSYVISSMLTRSGLLLEYQITQTARNEFVLHYVPHAPSEEPEPRLRAILERELDAFGLAGRIRVTWRRVEEVPKDPATGRLVRVVSDVGRPPGFE